MEYLIAAGAFIGGGVVGGIAMAVIASGKVSDVEGALYIRQSECRELRRQCEKLSESSFELRGQLRDAWSQIEITKNNLKQMVVSYRGNKGRYTRGSAYDALEFHLSKKDA